MSTSPDQDAPPANPTRSSRVRLSPSAVVRCRRRVHLDHDPTVDRTSRDVPDSTFALRMSDLDGHRQQVVDAFPAQLATGSGSDAVTVTPPTTSWTPESTDRPSIVRNVSLRSDTRYGVVDFLIHDGTGYRPVIIRGHRTLDRGAGAHVSTLASPLQIRRSSTRKVRSQPRDTMALAHFQRLLGELGLGSSSGLGGVIGRGGVTGDSETICWQDLSAAGVESLIEYDLRFADRLAVASAAVAGEPALAQPTRIAECRRCPWNTLCTTELAAAHDISLVAPGVDADAFRAQGLNTIDDLANAEQALVSATQLTAVKGDEAIVRARAWLQGVNLVRRRPEVRVARADIELDVDMESYVEDGAYLWGTLLTGSAGGEAVVRDAGYLVGYRSFATWEVMPTADEGRAFAQFWAFLAALRELASRHQLTFAAYCYSRAAEDRWLKSTPVRYPDVPGMPTPAMVAEFLASPEWVDIYAVIGEEFLVPGSRRLKALAPLAGFHWRDAEAGGENSMAWYRAAVGADGAPPDQQMRQRVLQYNEDDVLATHALRHWMTDLAVAQTPTISEMLAD